MNKSFSVLKYMVMLILAAIFYSCNIDESSTRLLVPASGKAGEIILVIDSTQWQGELGEVLRETLEANLPGVSRPESLFTVRYIEPTLFNSVLNKARNLIFVATLDSKTKGGEIVRNYMTNNYIQEHPDKFIISQKNLYASGQNALYLFSATTDELIERIRNNKSTIRNFFNQKENENLKVALYKSKEEKAVADYMNKKYGFSIRVPNGYRIEEEDSAFFWIRNVGQVDKNIFVTYRKYTDESIFKNKYLIGLRDSITHYRIFEDPANPDTYMRVDTLHMETEYTTVDFHGHYGKRIRGIWNTGISLGGSFISYVFVDEETNRLYFLDGFVASPGHKKREALRELDVILNTYKTYSAKESKTKT